MSEQAKRIRVHVVLPVAVGGTRDFTKVVDNDQEAIAQEVETIAEGFRHGMPERPLQIVISEVGDKSPIERST